MTAAGGDRRSAPHRLETSPTTDAESSHHARCSTRTSLIWATWLPRLLTGENSCEWAIRFKANHQGWTRQPSDFDQAQWLLSHTALVNERIRNWTVGGFEVDVQGQNRFELRGRTATLAGRPDIIAHREDKAVIVDAKTGNDSPSHAVQVMIYVNHPP